MKVLSKTDGPNWQTVVGGGVFTLALNRCDAQMMLNMMVEDAGDENEESSLSVNREMKDL